MKKEELENRGFTVKRGRISCEECAPSTINGIAVHESRCPAERIWFECSECNGGEWVHPRNNAGRRFFLCVDCRVEKASEECYTGE